MRKSVGQSRPACWGWRQIFWRPPNAATCDGVGKFISSISVIGGHRLRCRTAERPVASNRAIALRRADLRRSRSAVPAIQFVQGNPLDSVGLREAANWDRSLEHPHTRSRRAGRHPRRSRTLPRHIRPSRRRYRRCTSRRIYRRDRVLGRTSDPEVLHGAPRPKHRLIGHSNMARFNRADL